jgi:hypothetical protein
MKLKQTLAAAAIAAALPGAASAAVLLDPTVYTNWTIESFDAIDPAVVVPVLSATPPFFSSYTLPGHAGPSVTMTATIFAQVGQIGIYELQDNGVWGAGNGFVGTDFQLGPSGEVTFVFSSPVATVGAIMNALQPTGMAGNALNMSIRNQNGGIIESSTFTPDTDPLGYNEGQFAGFTRNSADIYSFTVNDGKFVMDDLRWAVAPIPEPGEYAMMLAGLGMLGMMMRRRRQQ